MPKPGLAAWREFSARSNAIEAASLSRSTILLMAVACGCAVSTLYYNQPLLPRMGASFGRSAAEAGLIATLTQLGYACGLFLFVPLGDLLDRRRLVLCLLAGNMLSLAGVALAPGFQAVVAASFAVGLTAVTAQIIIPAISGLAAPAERGRVVGALLSGLSAGLLLARTLSGFVGAHAGWRTMFLAAMVIDLPIMIIVWTRLPGRAREFRMSYPALFRSMGGFIRTEPVLRAAAVTGFLMFAAFSAFWSTLAMLVARPPYGFGPDVAGAFGFVGIAGLLASPIIGRAVDRYGPSRVLAAGALADIAAFACVGGAEWHILAVIAAAAMLDIGNRAAIIANQSRIYALFTDARSRLNTVFMTSYFLGGATGAAMAAHVAGTFGWPGLAVTGGGFALAALVAHIATS
jgi:predicted MFS family arabinose efflux permease